MMIGFGCMVSGVDQQRLLAYCNPSTLTQVMASKTKIYIVLEFVSGGELFEKIANDGKLKENKARQYFQQPINAVDYCHSRVIIYQVLKGYDGSAVDIWSCDVILFVLMVGFAFLPIKAKAARVFG
ncbi:hypothetical protein K1719_033680 [Acacia pycnantha]|nr:hypothetical protein K1719_033680 [Acacia pycnantha]